MSDEDLPRTPRFGGIVTTAELLASGISTTRILGYVERGTLTRVGRGVYAVAQPARGEHLLRATAALAVIAPGAALSHQSAARLLGIDLLGRPKNEVTMTVPPERGWRTRAGIRVCAAGLPPEHVTVIGGLTMTTAARTVVDLARTGGFWDGLVAADSALRKKLTTKDEMRAVIGALRHWPGIRRAAEVVEFADRRSESALESIARAVIRDLGLPPPDLKYKDPARAKDQLRRDIELRAAGFEVVHFDWRDITRAPDRVAAVIREAFVRGKLREQIARGG
jgi:hypothetical protein